MQKYITRNRVSSSNSQQKPSTITPQKSLIKLKQRLQSGYGSYGTVSHNQRSKQEYMVRENQNMGNHRLNEPKTTDYKKRRKESLDLINRDIKFENQLKEEIRNLNATLGEWGELENELIRQNDRENTSSIVQQNYNKQKQSSTIDQYPFFTKNLKELAYLQQRIKDREKQIESVTQNIAQLKQDYWNINTKKIPLQQKPLPSYNTNMDRFVLADQVSKLNQQLKATMKEYKKKYNDLKAIKVTINNAYKDSQHFYELRVKKSQKSKALLLEKPITYSQFKQILLKKKKQAQNSKNKDLHRVKSLENLLPSNINQFSNISNVSAILPNNLLDQWLNRQLLSGEIPCLPKQTNPTMKSMNLKKNKLKQAIEIQKSKHQKQMTQLIDKLLFLHDEDTFLTEELESHELEINGLEAKFSYIEMRTRQPTTVSKKSVPNTKRKLLEEESSIHFVEKNYNNKNYIQENLLLDNTGNNSSILELTGRILKFA